jgi:hypothetical protein
MKIAYCFSGMIRNLNECSPKWKEIIEKNPGDVYGHFWEKSDKNNETVDDFIKIFNPKKVEIENFEIFKESTVDIMLQNVQVPNCLHFLIQDSIRNGSFISFHYKIWKANQLSLEEKYDIIVRCRTDYYPDTKIKFETNDMINIPVGKIYVPSWNHSTGPIDLFAYGNRKLMNYYSCVYLYIMKYLKQGFHCFPYEHILGTHLNHKDILIREIPIDIFNSSHASFNSFADKIEYLYNTLNSAGFDDSAYSYIENRKL